MCDLSCHSFLFTFDNIIQINFEPGCHINETLSCHFLQRQEPVSKLFFNGISWKKCLNPKPQPDLLAVEIDFNFWHYALNFMHDVIDMCYQRPMKSVPPYQWQKYFQSQRHLSAFNCHLYHRHHHHHRYFRSRIDGLETALHKYVKVIRRKQDKKNSE